MKGKVHIESGIIVVLDRCLSVENSPVGVYSILHDVSGIYAAGWRRRRWHLRHFVFVPLLPTLLTLTVSTKFM